MKAISVMLLASIFMTGCMSAAQHKQDVNNDAGDRLTVGKVQREIREGMSSAQVAETLGSPNIVSTDQDGNEVWMYDKISTTKVYSTSSGGVSALVLGFGSSIGGGVAPGYSQGSGATSTSQRTLTIIIKFNENNRVKKFSYRSSSF
ncbi:hypothetical protein [Marinobacterium rhizophilum]|uniref:Lipoprotein SmpA/OmlA domain-containing protein n=1 Tax=Marinobacterium rhizophilum TaxID=420402 RepID=A0ABY5HM03_9GAMM|nr:hypothetical protein [Marinobacterium rhizophilum]UTW13164.1 hypothetical protein KDW95_05745 [Marinobacterium rhizophilum]